MKNFKQKGNLKLKKGTLRWTYYMGFTPIYAHAADDHRLFRLFTSIMIDAGTCRHTDIVKTFGVPKSNVNRALKKRREGAPEAFFQRKPGGRKGHILKPEALEQAQDLLNHGVIRHDIAQQLEVKLDTLRKAINDGVMEFPDTEKVVNPSWRELNRSRNQVQSRLHYRRAHFSEMTMHPQSETEPEKYQK